MRKEKKLAYILGLIVLISVLLLVGVILLFPSRDYMKMTFSEKISQGYSTNILINGDSIGGSTAEGEWGTLLKDKLVEDYDCYITVQNISKAGNSCFAGIVSWEMLDNAEKKHSDLVILCYGQNDSDDESFAENYEALIRNTIRGNPNAEIVAVLESSQREYTNKIQIIMNLCAYYDIPYVDMIESFNSSGYSYEDLSDDGIHPNALGKEIYSEAIYDVVSDRLLRKQSILDFRGERPKKRSAQNIKSEQYERFHYIPLKKMKVNGNKVIAKIPQSRIVGIDTVYVNGSHSIQLNISGQQHEMGYTWPYEFSQRHIYPVLENNIESGEAEIIFEKPENVQNFLGLICFE